MKASLGIVNLKELGDKRAKKAAIILLQVIATAVLVAIAAWRLGHLLGIEPQLLDTMLALGLPLIVFFFGGVFGLVAIAWIIGMAPALLLQRFNLNEEPVGLLAGIIMFAATVFWSWLMEEDALLGAAYVVGMVAISALFWWLSRVLRTYWLQLVAWEWGVAAIFVPQVIDRDFLPNADFVILTFVIGLVPIALLFVPRVLVDVGHPEHTLSHMQWASLVTIHGAGASFGLPLFYFAVSRCIGFARAAVHIGLMPLIMLWVGVAVILAFIGWLIHRGIAGFACAIVLVALLWLASAYPVHFP